MPAIALLLGIQARFVLDDAFISFHYARSLVEGDGLTWFGERVEGYTNFGWVLWLAVGFACGIEPVAWSQASGIATFVGATVLLWRIASSASAGPLVPWVATLGFVTNFSVHSFATSGLATMPQTFFVLAAFRCAQRAGVGDAPFRALGGCSLFAALALWTRLDSAVLLAPIGLWALATIRRMPQTERLRAMLWLCLPIAALVGGWLAWKLTYYGAWLPNSYTAKVRGSGWVSDGALQWARFALWYSIAPVIVLFAATAAVLRSHLGTPPTSRPTLWMSFALLFASFAYLASVGGDFMEFRFLVPAAPYCYLAVGLLFDSVCDVTSGWGRTALAGGTVLVLALSSVQYGVTFHTDSNLRMDGIRQLGDFYGRYPDGRWDRIGSALEREFGATAPTLAVSAAGAIPYYSRLESVDLWGLNDRTIPTLGLVSEFRRPGHRHHATFDYLRSRGVDLIIGDPALVADADLVTVHRDRDFREWASRALPAQESAPAQLDIVAMPIDPGVHLLIWIFRSSPELESSIRGWPRWQIPYHAPSPAPHRGQHPGTRKE